MRVSWVLGVLVAALVLSGSASAALGWGFGSFGAPNMGPYSMPYISPYAGQSYIGPYSWLHTGQYYNSNYGARYYEPSWGMQSYAPYNYYLSNYAPCCGSMWDYGASWDRYPQTYYYGGLSVSYGGASESCAGIDVAVGDVSVAAGRSASVVIEIHNRTGTDFDVGNMEVYIDSFDVQTQDISTPGTVPANGMRTAAFRVYAEDDARGGMASANVKVAGQFSGANYCDYGAVGPAYFNVRVTGQAEPGQPGAPDDDGPAESTSRIVYRPSTWVDIEVDDWTGDDGTVVACEPGYVVPDCAGLDIVSHSITVQAGGRQNEEFWLKNYTTEDFHIDSVDVYETSNNFVLSAGSSDAVAFKDGDFGKIALVVNAFEVERDDFSRALVTVTGHFESGVHCTVPAEEFYVYVNTEQNRCGGLDLEVQNAVELAEGAETGIVRIGIDNPLATHATVTVSAENADVYPNSINVGGESYAERMLYVTLDSQADARLNYRISAGNCALAEKFTIVEYVPEPVHAGMAEISIESFPQEIEILDSRQVNVVVRNDSDVYAVVEAGISGLPDEFYVRPVQAELAPGTAGLLVVGLFQNGAMAGSHAGVLKVSAGETEVNRQVAVVVVGAGGTAVAGDAGSAADNAAGGSGKGAGNDGAGTGEGGGDGALPAVVGNTVGALSGAAGTALVVLGDNAVNLGIVILILILIYILYKAISGPRSVRSRHWAGA